VKGSTPKIDHQITRLVPMRSPIGPPITVPAATENRNRNKKSCALCTDSPKVWIR